MRCRDAKVWLTAQRDNDLARSEISTLQEHLKHCVVCRTHEERQKRLDTLLHVPASRMYSRISTERIMRAVEQQRRITQQLVDIRAVEQHECGAVLRDAGPRAIGVGRPHLHARMIGSFAHVVRDGADKRPLALRGGERRECKKTNMYKWD